MIKEDSDACIKHMEDILIKQLQGQITLAQCLKSVGLLRRIGTYTDTQLKVIIRFRGADCLSYFTDFHVLSLIVHNYSFYCLIVLNNIYSCHNTAM